MRMQGNRGSKLFLMELIIAIFFFSVIVTICVQLFAGAYTMSVHSRELVQSVNLASNVAEYYRVWDWQEESWQEVFPQGEWQGEDWQIAYDKTWQPDKGRIQYMLRLGLDSRDGLHGARITISDEVAGRVIYELTVKRTR